jgi:hypothetical protein
MYKALALVGCIASLFAIQGCSKPKPADPPAAAVPAASTPAPSTPVAAAPQPTAPAVAASPSKPTASGPTGLMPASGGAASSDGAPAAPATPMIGLGNTGKPTASGPGLPVNTAGLVGIPGGGGGGKPTASGPGMSLPSTPAAPAGVTGFGGLMGAAGGSSTNAPPPPTVAEKATLKDRAINAFQAGNTKRAYALMEAYALQVADEEAAEVLKDYRWAQGKKRPQLGINMAVGVTIKNTNNVKEIAPIGKDQGNGNNNGGMAMGGGGMSRTGGAGSGARGGGANGPIEVKSFEDATGDFGQQFVAAFQEKHDEGVWTQAFREYTLGGSSGGSGFGSSMAGNTGFGGGPPAMGDGGLGAPPGRGTGASGPPAGYAGGGGGGMPAGYAGGGGGPPAGYTGGGGGMPAGYSGGSGPPAGYRGGSSAGAPAGYGGAMGPPAGYNGGSSSGPPAGYGGASGPPAGYTGGSGGMKPSSGGAPGAPMQFRRRWQGNNMTDGEAPGPANAGNAGAGLMGGFGRPGFGGPPSAPSAPAAYGPDLELPAGFVALAPCLTYIGSDETNKLLKKANEHGFDGLFIFEIELTQNKVLNKVINETRIRLLLPKENIKETKAVFSSKRLNNNQAAKSRSKGESDGIDDVVELVVKKTQENFGLVQVPSALTPEVISSKRLPALASDKSMLVIDRLSEVNFYFSQGLIDDNQKADAFEKIAGATGQTLAIGALDERLDVVEKLLERDFK